MMEDGLSEVCSILSVLNMMNSLLRYTIGRSGNIRMDDRMC